ncbi:MAG TPA: NUDIX hydrolase [Thermoanaerobaculia bacterium]|nr:NUDIX hydrolase [Thermoanaerobaculia bacterium]
MDADPALPVKGRPAPRRDHSAGGLVVRGEEVLLISTLGGRRWQLPKGHLEAGETPEQAAVREVREETGVTGRILLPLPSIEYRYRERGRHLIDKRVDYFLLAYEAGHERDYDPKEVYGAAWFPWDEAHSRITFENERRVVQAAREAVARLAAGQPAGEER